MLNLQSFLHEVPYESQPLQPHQAGLVRIWYAKYGKQISRILLAGMAGATLCYLVAGLASALFPLLGTVLVLGMMRYFKKNQSGC